MTLKRVLYHLRASVLSSASVAALFACGAAVQASAGDAGDVEFGAYLASECASCHRPDAASDGIPPIEGMARERFIMALHAYREGERANQTMRSVARSLGEEEIRALAAYYASLEPETVDRQGSADQQGRTE